MSGVLNTAWFENHYRTMKNRFHVPKGTYLLSHSVGCLPQKTQQVLENHYLTPWKNSGGECWDSWLNEITEFKISLSMLLGSQPDAFCPQVNVSSALTKIVYSLEVNEKKNTFIHSASDFPSTGFVISQLKQSSFHLLQLSANKDLKNIGTWEKYLTEKTKVIFITHVNSNHSGMTPVAEIVKLAKQHNIITIIDIAQSVGIVPISLDEWDADFVIGSSVKWLCGGPGAAFLWANPERISEWNPKDVGWFSHQNPFEFDSDNFEYAENANRFWGGTPSISPFISATVGINEILNCGIEKIQRHNQRLTQKIITFALEMEIIVETPLSAEHRGGTLSIRLPEQQKAESILRKNNIYFDIRDNNLFRFSPHLYNDDNDINRLCEVIKTEIL